MLFRGRNMNESLPQVTVALRLPGRWPHIGELIEHLPAGCRITRDSLVLPDGTSIDIGFMKPDNQFAQIFRSSCRDPASAEELAVVDGYTVNVVLSGPGGSMDAARAMMRAAAAIVSAGAAGVFIDNCVLAHGGRNWLEMTDDGGPDALSFAFVGIVRGKLDVWTSGMHVLGLRDIVMKRADLDADGFDIVEVIRYLCRGDKPVHDRHLIVDLDGPRFLARAERSEGPVDSPIYNPFGRLRLVSMREIAENN
jgi:hypothetical protein